MKAKMATANSHIHHWLKSSSASVGLFVALVSPGTWWLPVKKKCQRWGALLCHPYNWLHTKLNLNWSSLAARDKNE